jgi:hypothetical protein
MENIKLLIPLSGILFGTLMPVTIVWLVLRYRTSRNQLVYDTAVKLAEKGQPVPAELFTNLNPTGSDLRRGFLLIMLGVAICICLYELGVPWTFGLIPLLMGVGFLIVWRLESRDAAKTTKEPLA